MTREEEIKEKAIEIAMPCFNGECKDFIDDPCMGTPCYANERYEAAISMAEWADQNPREGLWDAEKVVEWILNNYETYEQTYTDNSGNHTYSDFQICQFIRSLREAMEEQQ